MIVIKWVFGAFRYMIGAIFGLVFDIVFILRELFTLFESDGKDAPSFKSGFNTTKGSMADIVDDIKEELKKDK